MAKAKKSKIKLIWAFFFGNKQQRYEAAYWIFSKVTGYFGLRLYNKNLAWFFDEEFLKVWKSFPEGANRIHERKYNLYYFAKAVKNVPGDLAECGVFIGGSSYLMLSANKETNKTFHGFDSFEGLSEPGADDKVTLDRTFKWKKHDMSVPEERAASNLKDFKDRVHLYKGWIPTRFPEVKDKKFSFVHIDVDLYDPTYATLDFFYSKLSPGGVIICDDYGSEACPGAYKAMNDFFADKKEAVVHLTTGQGLVTKL
jgi:O-methyltransferase